MNEALFADFLKTRDVLWVGVNFAKAKFTREGFDFNQEILQHYLQEWNKLILNDQKKYDIRMSFRKPVMKYDLSAITKLNKSLKINDVLTLFISSQHVYSDDQMRAYATTLDLPTTLRFALMFVVESFDTSVKTASIWVVVTETATKEVVLCEKFLKKPAGMGTRNYWARTFYNVFYDNVTRVTVTYITLQR